MLKNKKGMVQQLSVIGYGIIGLVVLVGIGLTLLTKFGDTVVTCGATDVWNTSLQLCTNISNASVTSSGRGGAYTAISYGVTQLGSTGLLSWLPAIIALLVGVFFLAYFAGGKKKGKHY